MRKLLVIFLCYYSFSFGQDNSRIDSLKQIVFTEKLHDTLISRSYFELAKHYKKNDKDSCIYFLDKLKDYSTRTHSNLGGYYYYKLRAGYYTYFIEEDEQLEEFIITNLLKSLEYAEKNASPEYICIAYSRLSEEYSRFGRFDKGVFYAEKQAALSIKNNLWKETAYAYSLIGENNIYYYKRTDVALKYLIMSDSIYTAHNFKGKMKGQGLATLGNVYKDIGDLDRAKEYQTRALKVFEDNEDEYQQMHALGAIASIERENKNYKRAAELLLNCIKFYKENDYPEKEAGFSIGLSEVYFDEGQLQKAIQYIDISLGLSKKYNNEFLVLLGTIHKSRYLLAKGDYLKSNQLALEANTMANGLESLIDKGDVLKLLYESSEKLKDYKKAYQYAIEYQAVKDSLLKKENIQQMQALETQFQTKQKEQEITLLKSKSELAEQEQTNQRNILLGSIGLTSIAGLFFFVLFRNRQKTNRKLKELDAFKSKLFTNISHEFRTPLTLISGPIDQRLSKAELNEVDRAEFTMIQRNSERLLNLVNQLLDLSKLESGHLKLKVAQGDLSALLKALASSFQHKASQKKITYHTAIPAIPEAWYDTDIIEKTVVNLLSNAFKYTPKSGQVKFEVSVSNNHLQLYVENNSQQLTKVQIENIFNRFYQADENSDGVGIGLSLVKELVTLSHGEISVANVSESALAFTVSLPILKAAFNTEEIAETIEAAAPYQAEADIVETTPILEHDINEDLPILLIVDDQEDIRSFIKSAFKDSYQVVEAHDGVMGVEKAIALVPDMIICDVMMPNKNGFKLTTELKEDERTSHIPIVLLTAKVEDANRFEGLETGADDYITKPFKIKGLEARVKNLISSRARLRERYSQELVLRPKDIAISSFDEQFLEKLQEVLDKELTEASFSVEDFSKALGMSRMQLHRKLKALTGLSATEFVRSQRLKLAAILLKKSDANISEIGYMVGFNDPSYFAKCFKDAYGCSPTEYTSRL